MKSLMAAKCTTVLVGGEGGCDPRAAQWQRTFSGDGEAHWQCLQHNKAQNHSTSLSSLALLVQALSLPPPQQSTVRQYTYNSPGSSIDHYKKSTINTSFVFPTSLDTTGSYLSPYSNKC